MHSSVSYGDTAYLYCRLLCSYYFDSGSINTIHTARYTPCYHHHHTFCGICIFSSCSVPSTHCVTLPASECLTQGFETQDVPLVYTQDNLY